MSLTYHDSFNTRCGIVKSNKDITYVINIESTLPMIISNDDYITNSTYHTEDNIAFDSQGEGSLQANTKFDNNDRFVFITKVYSIINKTSLELYYDNKYEDILVIPDSSFTKHYGNNSIYTVGGYRVGSGSPLTMNNSNILKLSPNDDNSRVKLPKCKSDINSKVLTLAIAGIRENDISSDFNYEEYITKNVFIKRSKMHIGSYIELGKASDIFEDSDKSLPLYLLRQMYPRRMGYDYLGNITPPTDNKIYIPINF